MTENEMLGKHHQLNVHEFEKTPRDGKGQGSLSCYSSCYGSCPQRDMT